MQYAQMADFYDLIYGFKNYKDEVIALLDVINPYLKHNLKTLLDVACGTGRHLEHLKNHFKCEGLDISPELLNKAKKRLPDITFHQANMLDFKMDRQYDIITCFFGSIGHVITVENLFKTVRNLKKHLSRNGLMIIEPWHTPKQYKTGRTSLLTIDEPDLKIARCCSSQANGKVSVLDLHHLVCTPEGTEHFVEHLELGLFAEDEYIEALSEGGFTVRHESIRNNGNGVYLAFKK